MNENELAIKAIEWYNQEKITLTNKMLESDPKFDRYKNAWIRIIEIDKLIKELTQK